MAAPENSWLHQKGLPNVQAALLASIDESTFYRWLNHAIPTEDNPNPEARYCKFCKSVKEAEADFIEAKVRRAANEPTVIERQHIRTVGEGKDAKTVKEITRETRPPTWAPAAWLLERRRPDLFGRRIEHAGEIATPSDGPKVIQLVFADEETAAKQQTGNG